MVNGSLNEEQWRTVLELSEAVIELPAGERRAYLVRAGADPAIVAEVLELAAAFNADVDDQFHSRLGTRVGRFEITGFVGRGGMGEVYAAHDPELGRTVALKFLNPDMLAFDGGIQRFIHEARTASTLNHPNIVTIYDIVRTDGTIAIAMELVDGEPLRPPGRDARGGSNRVLEIGEQIALALSAAHGRGIVHRDIKPDNILVQPDGRVKVLDFGLARQARTESGVSTFYGAGTLRYLSPEQARSEPATPASDVFSLGLVLYELASGRHPFPGDSPFDTVHAILNSEPESLAEDGQTPRSFVALVEAMLSKDPARRPTASDVARQLGEIRRQSVERVPQQAKPSRRRFWIWAAIMIAVVGVAARWTALWPDAGDRFADLQVQPLTSQPGWEAAPAFSPDGQRIAFTWCPQLESPQIYVKRLDGEDPVKLTSVDSGRIGYLAWSPDGTRIAFKRQSGDKGGIYSIPSSGGPETLLVELANANTSSAIDWSPDGLRLASSDRLPGTTRLAIYLYDLQTGEKIRLTDPPAGVWGDWNPKFSPDGRRVAFKRVTGFWGDNMFAVPAAGGAPQQVTTMGTGIWGHAWTADGQSLLVSCQREGTVFGIWRFPLANPTRPERIQQGGFDSITPAAAARNPLRIAWVHQIWNLNIYRAGVSGSERPVPVIASTQRDQAPAWSPDGRIAFVSDRSGSREIWIAKGDGSGQTRMTSFKGPPIDHLAWSPDGRRLVFDARIKGKPVVFSLECESTQLRCSEPKTMESNAESPSWSADGQAIYYASYGAAAWDIWKRPFAGGPARRMTQGGGSYSRESPDGEWLYFARSKEPAIFRLPLGKAAPAADQAAELVVGAPFRVQSMGWAITRDELFFIDQPARDKPAAVRAVSLSTRKVRFVRHLGPAFANREDVSLAVSANGKWVLYPQLDSSGSNVVVADLVR